MSRGIVFRPAAHTAYPKIKLSHSTIGFSKDLRQKRLTTGVYLQQQ